MEESKRERLVSTAEARNSKTVNMIQLLGKDKRYLKY